MRNEPANTSGIAFAFRGLGRLVGSLLVLVSGGHSVPCVGNLIGIGMSLGLVIGGVAGQGKNIKERLD